MIKSELIKNILNAEKDTLNFPYNQEINSYFGEGEYNNIVSFGFAYVENVDHYVRYLIATPSTMKKIIRQINDVELHINKESIGELWTALLLLNDKIGDHEIIFANEDLSVVLNLNNITGD